MWARCRLNLSSCVFIRTHPLLAKTKREHFATKGLGRLTTVDGQEFDARYSLDDVKNWIQPKPGADFIEGLGDITGFIKGVEVKIPTCENAVLLLDDGRKLKIDVLPNGTILNKGHDFYR